MATDGTIDNPRLILATSVEPVGFYFTGTDTSTGEALTDTQILALDPFIALIEKSRPQSEPPVDSDDYKAATWGLGKKGRRADIVWGTDFTPTPGTTYVGYGRVVGADQPAAIFGYLKAV